MSCGKRFYGTTIKPQSIFYSILLKAKLQPAENKMIYTETEELLSGSVRSRGKST